MKTYDNHLSKYHFLYNRAIIPEMFLLTGENETENDAHEGADEEESITIGHEKETQSISSEAQDSTLPDGAAESFEYELKHFAMCWILKIKENCKLT